MELNTYGLENSAGLQEREQSFGATECGWGLPVDILSSLVDDCSEAHNSLTDEAVRRCPPSREAMPTVMLEVPVVFFFMHAPKDADKLCDMTRAASDHFERGQLNKAAQCYREILMAFPGDPVAKSLLAICPKTVNS